MSSYPFLRLVIDYNITKINSISPHRLFFLPESSHNNFNEFITFYSGDQQQPTDPVPYG